MKTKNYVLIGSGLGLGLMAALTIGVTQAKDTAAAAEASQERHAGAAGVEQRSLESVIPLDEVVARFEQKYKGKVTDIELDRELTRDVYEIEVSDSQGYEWDVETDAHSGEILEEKRERDD